jgi:hypothetical protein
MTEERIRCFDLKKRFSRQLRLALPRMCFRTGWDSPRRVAGGLEEILKRPAAGQVNADATSCFADARTNLEQLNAQRFDLCGAHRQRQLQAKQSARSGTTLKTQGSVANKRLTERLSPFSCNKARKTLVENKIVLKSKEQTSIALTWLTSRDFHEVSRAGGPK